MPSWKSALRASWLSEPSPSLAASRRRVPAAAPGGRPSAARPSEAAAGRFGFSGGASAWPGPSIVPGAPPSAPTAA